MKIVTVISAAIAFLCIGTGVAHADTGDTTYLRTLDVLNIPYGSPSIAVELGHEMCDALSQGVTWKTLVDAASVGGFTGYQAGEIVGAATVAYCPQFSDIVNDQAVSSLGVAP